MLEKYNLLKMRKFYMNQILKLSDLTKKLINLINVTKSFTPFTSIMSTDLLKEYDKELEKNTDITSQWKKKILRYNVKE